MDEIRTRVLRQMALLLAGILAPVLTAFINKYIVGHVRALLVRAFYGLLALFRWIGIYLIWKPIKIVVVVIGIVGEYALVGFFVTYSLSEGIFFLLCLYDKTYGLHNSSLAHYFYGLLYDRAAVFADPLVHFVASGFATTVDFFGNSSQMITRASDSVLGMFRHMFRV